MYVIGITGGTGAGKSTAMRALQKLGALVLDCDEIYHELLTTDTDIKAELQSRFEGVLTNDEIDRMKLGKIVFNDPYSLKDLNAITHKYVSAEVDKRIAKWETQGGTIAAIDAIALIESGKSKDCNVVVGVTAPVETRIARITQRDGIAKEQAQSRLYAQQADEFYRNNCDHIIENTYSSPAEFEVKCIEFFRELLQR